MGLERNKIWNMPIENSINLLVSKMGMTFNSRSNVNFSLLKIIYFPHLSLYSPSFFQQLRIYRNFMSVAVTDFDIGNWL